MKCCCTTFQGWFEEAGKRGLGVFVSSGDSKPAFVLQYRALDPGVSLPRTDFPFSSVSDVRIHFCPWCGSNLKKWYRGDLRELDRSELQVSLK
jgi:hypothetical protein